jgi:hypothetical protein
VEWKQSFGWGGKKKRLFPLLTLSKIGFIFNFSATGF